MFASQRGIQPFCENIKKTLNTLSALHLTTAFITMIELGRIAKFLWNVRQVCLFHGVMFYSPECEKSVRSKKAKLVVYVELEVFFLCPTVQLRG